MLRFDLDDAEILGSRPLKGVFRLMTGHRIKAEDVGDHAEVPLN